MTISQLLKDYPDLESKPYFKDLQQALKRNELINKGYLDQPTLSLYSTNHKSHATQLAIIKYS